MKSFNAICLLFAVLFLSSCSTSKDYGSLHKRFSSDRIAHFSNETPKRIYKTKTYDTREKRRSGKAYVNTEESVIKRLSISKVMYHSERNNVIREANKYNGIPYVYGGKTPEKGFDCSGFVTYVYNNQGVMLNGNAQYLSKLGRRKSVEDLVKGDLIFFGDGKKVTHVGIVTLNDGNNLSMIHSSASAGIRSEDISNSDYWKPKLMYGSDIISAHLEEEL